MFKNDQLLVIFYFTFLLILSNIFGNYEWRLGVEFSIKKFGI